MMPFVLSLLAPIVISTVLDRLQKFGKDTDWTKVKIDTDTKVRSIVPGTLLDDVAVRFVNRLIDNIRTALLDTAEEKKVLDLVASGNLPAAGQEILKHAFPNA